MKLTWKDAKAFCEAETSDLMAVNDESEDSLLSSMMRYLKVLEVWIGLNDLEYKDWYQWSDGSEVRIRY